MLVSGDERLLPQEKRDRKNVLTFFWKVGWHSFADPHSAAGTIGLPVKLVGQARRHSSPCKSDLLNRSGPQPSIIIRREKTAFVGSIHLSTVCIFSDHPPVET